jgi:hypothetical protein
LPFGGITALVEQDVKRTFSNVQRFSAGLSRLETLEGCGQQGAQFSKIY